MRVAAKPLWNQIYDELREGIESGALAVGASMPGEHEVAERWGVSRLTAHRAFYELQRSGLVARKRKVGTVVLAPRARTLRIGALFFHAGDYFQGNLLAEVRAGLCDTAHLSYVDTDHDPAAEAEALCRMRDEADGIVLFPTCAPENDALLRELVAGGTPLVCVDRHPEGVVCDSVQTDNHAAARDAMLGLLADGHRRIAFLGDDEFPVSSSAERVRAYRETLAGIGEIPDRRLHLSPYLEPVSGDEYRSMVGHVRAALALEFEGPEPPTALFCLREHYALAAAEACASLGVPLPEIAAFVDRPPYLMSLPDSVRRVRQDLATIGRVAADRVARRARGEALPPETILVPALAG